mgnify:FL=1
MITSTHNFPPLPEIGHPESWYAKRAREAEHRGEHYAHDAYKVGQYITLALDQHLPWEEKLRYFRHALKRHCQPPPLPDEEVWAFYSSLAALVREYAGREALRIASNEDDMYAAREAMGQPLEAIEDDAEVFFARLIPDECPEWFSEEDYRQLILIRDQWI